MLLRRPLKFVVVGEVASGKTTLIKQFAFGDSTLHATDESEYSPTFVCDGSTLALKANVKFLQSDESFKSLTGDNIELRLREKKFKPLSRDSESEAPREGREEWVWNKISVDVRGVEVKWPQVDDKSHGRNIVKSTSALTSHGEKESEQWSSESARPHSMVAPETATPKPTPNSPEQPEMSLLTVPKTPPRKPPRKEGVAKLHRVKDNTDVVEIEVDMWDTGGDRRFMWYRWYACTGADAVLMCVPLSSIMDFGVEQNWESRNSEESATGTTRNVTKSLQKFMSDEFLSERTRSRKANYRIPPVLLVGTKSDVCTGACASSVNDATIDAIGMRLAREIGCCDFVCCSAFDASTRAKVFETAVAVSLTSDGKYRASRNAIPSMSSESEAESTLSREVEQPTYFKMHSSSPRQDAIGETSDSVVRRSPTPRIFFPPPPDSTPPSTGPPSSSSSRSASHGSSSLESLVDSLSDYQASTLALCGSHASSENLVDVMSSDAKSSSDDIAAEDQRVDVAVDETSYCESEASNLLEENVIVHTHHSEIESDVCTDAKVAENGDEARSPDIIESSTQNRPSESRSSNISIVTNPVVDDTTMLPEMPPETPPPRLEPKNLSSRTVSMYKKERPSPQKRRDDIFLRFLKT